MQTVITWQRPMDNAIYPPVGNPCTFLLGNALCYIISGLMLLVVGVIITSLSFQNLEGYKEGKRERYAGPVLICAGILVIARGAFSKLRPSQGRSRVQIARHRNFIERYMREIYRRPFRPMSRPRPHPRGRIHCDIHPSYNTQDSPRRRLYSDEPPSYDVVARYDCISNPFTEHSFSANQSLDDAFETEIELCNEAPPSYDEFMRTTRGETTSL